MAEKNRKLRLIALGTLITVIGGVITKQALRKPSSPHTQSNNHSHSSHKSQTPLASNTSPGTDTASSPQRSEGRILGRLNAASTLIMSAAIVATLAVSFITLRSQLQQHNAAVASSARAAKVSFASKIVFWWSPATNPRIEVLHVQNDNPLPVDAWVVYLPDDKQPAPGSGAPLAGARLLGAFSPPPYQFVGQVPPCSVVEVRAPFESWHNPSAFNTLPSVAEGDLLFTDPSGIIWRRTLSGLLHTLTFSIKGPGATLYGIILNPFANIESIWSARSASPVCGQ